MATPEDKETKALTGCVVIFNDPPFKRFKYPMKEGKVGGTIVDMTDSRAATGACIDGIDQSCIGTVTQRARDLNYDANRNNCEILERELNKDSLIDVLGLAAKRKSDRLMKIAKFTSYGNNANTYNAYIEQGYKISPVLTVFVGGSDSLVDRTSSQMMCLKVVTAEEGIDDPNRSGSLATTLGGSGLVVTSIAALVGVCVVL
ncbi:hypothetical protein FQN49_004754 [Arthroderma sp. PD_2]|nr:hypothetical protein FQN49_004754 [Arthroderma sp. PD_2]